MGNLRYLCMGAGIVLFILFMIPPLIRKICNIGTVTGILLSGLLVLYGGFAGNIHERIRTAAETAGGRALLAAVILLSAAVFAAVAAGTALMKKAAANRPPENVTAVVLGCKVIGTKPSRILQERLEAAYDYLIKNRKAVAILSGGKGDDEEISEARCMYIYLTERGIGKERLLLEEHSVSTSENLLFSRKILREKGLGERINIVTSEFHAYRACDMAEKLGLEAYCTASHTFFVYLPTYYMRELYGILYYKIKHYDKKKNRGGK